MCATRGWEKVSESDVQKFQRRTEAIAANTIPTKPSKYRNKVAYVREIRFDSKHEAEVFLTLEAMQAAGVIHDLQRQVSFDLCCSTDSGLKLVVATYRSDFTWRDQDEQFHVGDAKSAGTRTALYVLKAKWMNLQYNIRIEEL